MRDRTFAPALAILLPCAIVRAEQHVTSGPEVDRQLVNEAIFSDSFEA